MQKKEVVIVGAGINGLVAANYLARAGFGVTIIERKDHAGGACTAATWVHEGVEYIYPQGASVLGFMEDFVFEETGLSKKIRAYCPEHPEIIYTPQSESPVLMWDDPKRLADELKKHWNEKGNLKDFLNDMEQVVSFLRKGYRDATVPTLQSAKAALGKTLFERWIMGSARDLLNHYLTSEPAKLFYSLPVTESGPVSLDAPYSAFTIPLMASGSIFAGKWGYVKDGIWQVPLELNKINSDLGVESIFSARVTDVSLKEMSLRYEKNGDHALQADYILFATDPLTASRIIKDESLTDQLLGEQLIGTSGKLVMFFKNPAQWKNDRGEKGEDAAFRYIFPLQNIDEFEKASNKVTNESADFAPGYFEIYTEGAGNRALGGVRNYELVSVFFKNLGFSKNGEEIAAVKKSVENFILEKILNLGDLFHSILETPKDLADLFFFPSGNIDSVEIAEGQTFFQRTYSPMPNENFYQFGSDPHILYCGAGTYPCGSVAGTPGYMCAKQLIDSLKK